MKEPTGRSPYQELPKNRFWRTGVAEERPHRVRDLYLRKFKITKDMRITTAGSCFAQHIGRQLISRSFHVLDYEPMPKGIDAEMAQRFGYGIYSARYGNIYLMRQLLQLGREALGHWKPDDIIWTKDGRFYDALRPSVEPDGLDSVDEVVALRESHLRAVRRLLTDTDLFIFTFGLTEGWVHRASQTVYPTAPGTIAGSFDPVLYEFKNFTFSEILEDFLVFRALMLSLNPAMRFLLTVSPVPLTATASADHVLAATTYSKSVLRAVAGQLAKEYNDIDYFPSFELITSHWTRGRFFESNLRSVSAAGVDTVMRMFFAQHDPQARLEQDLVDAASVDRSALRRQRRLDIRPVAEEGQLSRQERREVRLRQRQARKEAQDQTDNDVVCEDVLLEAFRK